MVDWLVKGLTTVLLVNSTVILQQIGAQFQIVGIGSEDNDHLQDARFGSYADLPRPEFGNFPSTLPA